MKALVATVNIQSGREAEFEDAFKIMRSHVQAVEPECLLYSLCRGEAPGVYVFMEQYEDAGAMTAHFKTEHYKTFSAVIRDCITGQPDAMRLDGVT